MDIFSPETRRAHQELIPVLRITNDQEQLRQRLEDRTEEASATLPGRLGRLVSEHTSLRVASVLGISVGGPFSILSGGHFVSLAFGLPTPFVYMDGMIVLASVGAASLGLVSMMLEEKYDSRVHPDPLKEGSTQLKHDFFNGMVSDLENRGFTILSQDIDNFSCVTHRGVAMAITEDDGSLALILNGQTLRDSYSDAVESPTRQVSSVSGGTIAVSSRPATLALTS